MFLRQSHCTFEWGGGSVCVLFAINPSGRGHLGINVPHVSRLRRDKIEFTTSTQGQRSTLPGKGGNTSVRRNIFFILSTFPYCAPLGKSC